MAIIKYKKRVTIKKNNTLKKKSTPSKKKKVAKNSPSKVQNKSIIPSGKQLKAILESESIHHFKKDMRLLNREELAQYVSSYSSNRIILIKLMKNIIWHAYEKIKQGKEPLLEGNIRTFWYLWVKPVLSHIPDDDNVRTDPYDTFLKAFTYMVMELRLFRYADFDFTDDNWEYRRIGKKYPQIILFGEKRGWIRYLRRIHTEYGITILTLGGAPSALTSEYTLQHISEVLTEPTIDLHLIGIVDYDPSGTMIGNAFKNQLLATGANSVTLTTLVHPKHYTKEEIAMFKFPLPKRQKTKTDNWMKKTQGIDGKPFGLESESFPREKLSALIKKVITQRIGLLID